VAIDVDPLADLYADEEDELYGLYEDEEEKPVKKKPKEEFRDVVSEELRQKGYEPDTSEEFERAGEKGIAEAYKGLASGLSLGASKYIPGLKPGKNLAADTGEFFGSVLPIELLLKAFGPIAKVAGKSPVFKRSLSALGRLTGVGLTGASYEGAKKAIEGEVPTIEDLTTHGTMWAALDAALSTLGLSGRFAKSLIQKAKGTNKPSKAVLNDVMNQLREAGEDFSTPERVSSKALAILEEGMPKATKELPPLKAMEAQSKAAEKEVVSNLEKAENLQKLSDNEIPFAQEHKPVEVSYEEAANDLENTEIDKKINEMFPKKIREQELGQNIQENLENTLQESKDIYTPLYDEARERSQYLRVTPITVSTRASQILESLQKLKTRPAGYNNVINTIENVLEDAGFTIERDEAGKFINAHAAQSSMAGDDLIELGKRLNEIVDYDVLDASVKDRLKPIINALKQDTRQLLSQDENALNAFEAAERLYGDTAEKFNRDPIRRIRSSEQPEKIVGDITSPSTLEMLREILQPEQMEGVERQILEEMKDLNYLQARKLFSELKPHLSYEADILGDQIVKSKLPVGSTAKTKALQNNILNDLSDSMASGQRPDKTLNLWKTEKGQKQIKDALKGLKNKDEIYKYLENQNFYDFASQFVEKDGKIDFKKFKEILKDKEFRNNLRQIGGQDAVNFFTEIEGRLKEFERNLEGLDKIPPKLDSEAGKMLMQKAEQRRDAAYKVPNFAKKQIDLGKQKKPKAEWGQERLKRMAAKDFPLQTKINAFLDFVGISGKAALTTFGFLKFGLPSTTLALLSYKMLNKLAQSPKARAAFRQAMQKPKDFTQLINAWNHLEKELDEGD
jgi:hypothetical protein